MNTINGQVFDFGANWLDYSQGLTETRIKEVKESLVSLDIKDKTFFDIGCGCGVFSIAAVQLGANRAVGLDISHKSIESCLQNREKFNGKNCEFIEGSILSDNTFLGKFDIVYAWGSLHHTGKMWEAIKTSANFVSNKGLFVIAIYNKHWSCLFWKSIKRFYNIAPVFIKYPMVWGFFAANIIRRLIFVKNPFKAQRGMSIYYDAVDWLGGYPYEYATRDEVINYVEKLGFESIKFIKAKVNTGCNEFVFRKF